MKVLWVTNLPIAHLREMLKLPLGQSGGWMETSYDALKEAYDMKLGVATIYGGTELLHDAADGNDFYAVPTQQVIGEYNPKDENNLSQWRGVIHDFKPDIIQIWGTEYSMGLCAQYASKGIPSVVYIQGLVSMIAKHCMDGISLKEQIVNASFYEVWKRKCLWQQKKKFEKSADIEKEILSNANAVIVESDWCGGICSMIAPQIKVYKSDLPINPVFSSIEWNYEKVEKNSIFTVSGGYPVKGHHILFEALFIVKKRYPNVKLYIPGASRLLRKLSFKEKIQLSSYDRILIKKIKQYGLQDNIVLLGRLTPSEMAERMSTCHCFVMPSVIENHSSSLIEAMMLGLPTISSFVGGLNSYYNDGENGFFYRADEPEHLASLIMSYFCDDGLCKRISHQGMLDQRKQRLSINLEEDFVRIYESIIKV